MKATHTTPSSKTSINVSMLKIRAWSLGLTVILVTLAFASTASAGTYPMYQCSTTAPSVAPGWSTYGSTTFASTVLADSCASGGTLGDEVFSNGQIGNVTENGSNGSQVGLNLTVPSGAPNTSIKSIAAKVIASPVSGNDAFLEFSAAGHALPGATELPYATGTDYVSNETWTLPQGARNFQAAVNCTTDHSSTTCNFAHAASVPALTEMTLTLEESTPPAITNVTGGLATGAASKSIVAGSQTLGLTGTDQDSGVHSATVSLTPQAGGPTDTHTFDFSAQCAYASWNACPAKQSVSGYSFDTSTVKDGIYTVAVSVQDAAGNLTEDPLGTLTTRNAPNNTSLPVILSPSQVTTGVALSTQPGNWTAASGAGNITFAYQWEDCDAQGTNCQTIAGAQNATYTPAPNDVGHTLRVLVIATDSDGTASATSSATSSVIAAQGSFGSTPGPGTGTGIGNSLSTGNGPGTLPNTNSNAGPSSPGASTSSSAHGAPNGSVASENAQIRLGVTGVVSRAYTDSQLKVTGRLLTDGQPTIGATLELLEQAAGTNTLRLIKHIKTGSTGTFTVTVARGPSRLLEVAYRAYSGDTSYAAVAKIKESSSASVGLHITPRHTSRTGTIKLLGTVLGQIPPHGIRIEVLVLYHGHWVPIPSQHTDKHGRFSVGYQFQGAVGRFPFKVVVPSGQAGFPYATGHSQTINVTTN